MAYKTKQLRYWQGNFGNAYIQRNSDFQLFRKRANFFKTIINKYADVTSILEIGCNIGGNLYILNQLKPDLKIVAIEPNKTAVAQTKKLIPQVKVYNKSIFDIKWKDKYNLVFTANVLIHISDQDLDKALTAIYDASNKYILIIEYHSTKSKMIKYRGLTDALYKRPYDKIIRAQFPNLILKSKGYLNENDGFDRSHWWLFHK